MLTDIKERLLTEGFAVVPAALSADSCDRYCSLVESAIMENRNGCVSNSSSTFGIRNLTDVIPEVLELLQQTSLRQFVEHILGAGAFLIRSTLFDKTDTANWGVFWHQDLAIAVQQRHEVSGFCGWTRKAGVTCCQPPAEVMNQIVAVRLHLDDCGADCGALKVLPGSHRHGRIAETDMSNVQAGFSETVCEVSRGRAVLINPLTLHASSPKTATGHRRVIHLEFTRQSLPDPLKWRFQVPLLSLQSQSQSAGSQTIPSPVG